MDSGTKYSGTSTQSSATLHKACLIVVYVVFTDLPWTYTVGVLLIGPSITRYSSMRAVEAEADGCGMPTWDANLAAIVQNTCRPGHM